MSGDLTARDDFVQQLAEVLANASDDGCFDPDRADESDDDRDWYRNIARAVLACGLVVSTSDVLNLAQRWEERPVVAEGYAAELCALTRQESR